MKRNKGFTLIELMIVVAIIAIISAIAIPNLLKGRIAANEAGAVGNLRTISSAHELYNNRIGNYVSTLLELNTAGQYIDASLAGASTDATTLKSGYWYFYTVTPVSFSAWCCQAQPGVWGTGGTRNFFIDQSGAIHYNLIAGVKATRDDKTLGE